MHIKLAAHCAAGSPGARSAHLAAVFFLEEPHTGDFLVAGLLPGDRHLVKKNMNYVVVIHSTTNKCDSGMSGKTAMADNN